MKLPPRPALPCPVAVVLCVVVGCVDYMYRCMRACVRVPYVLMVAWLELELAVRVCVCVYGRAS